MHRIIIFASGSGSNAENIATHFKNSNLAKVKFIMTNNPNAGVLQRAGRLQIPHKVFTKKEMETEDFLNFLRENADFIVLAGFLLKVPVAMINLFPQAIINIHPALLPDYGGKGMYGMHVHEAVVVNKEKESGITIHYVNENYDEGAIIFQKEVALDENDEAADVAIKIHRLEQENFPQVIEKLLAERNEG